MNELIPVHVELKEWITQRLERNHDRPLSPMSNSYHTEDATTKLLMNYGYTQALRDICTKMNELIEERYTLEIYRNTLKQMSEEQEE